MENSVVTSPGSPLRVITYGTFDLFHDGHRRLLERAHALGDYLVVGVTSTNYDRGRGKLNVRQSLIERIKNIEDSGLADLVIVEEYEGQKIHDIQELGIDVFAIGSDWVDQFDYLGDYCRVVYLERTKGISSTQLRDDSHGIVRLGVAGTGRIAERAVREARFVSGLSVEGAFSRDATTRDAFVQRMQLRTSFEAFAEMADDVDAVYIATPHGSHFELARQALQAGCHVLVEKPMTLTRGETQDLFDLSDSKGLVCLEAVKTAFAPGFERMVAVARSGSIGKIRSVDATFTKLIGEGRELEGPDGGSISELASYPLLAIIKLLGSDYTDVQAQSYWPDASPVELFSRIDVRYAHAIASARTGIGVKAEGDLIVAGTEGYLYAPAPWWLTEFFETRFEDPRLNKKFYYKFEGDGLRYELSEFVQMIQQNRQRSHRLRPEESVAIAHLMETSRESPVRFG